MNKKTIILLTIIVAIVFIGTILINLYQYKVKEDTFEIGIFDYDKEEFNLKVTDFPYKIKLVPFTAEDELLQAYISNDVDAIVIDGYSYIKNYGDLLGGRAIFSIRTPFVIKKSEMPSSANKIGSAYEWLLVNYNTHARIVYKNSKSALNALLENQVDEVLLPAKMLDSVNEDPTITSFGDIDMFLIVNGVWLHKDQDEELDLVSSLELITSDRFVIPSEVSLNAIVTKLFSTELIETRYYYKDLVYTSDTR